MESLASLVPEALIPKGRSGTWVHGIQGLSRKADDLRAALIHSSLQAEERHGSTEEHLRQLEGQLQEKNQELARVSLPGQTLEPPLNPRAASQDGLWVGKGGRVRAREGPG